jgi:hypothetical protein
LLGLWDDNRSIEMQSRVVIASVALVLVVGAFVTLSVSRRLSYMDTEGHVYEGYDPTRPR